MIVVTRNECAVALAAHRVVAERAARDRAGVRAVAIALVVRLGVEVHRHGVLATHRADLVQARIAIAHEGISRTNPDRIAAGLLNGVLGGGGFSSRLMRVVRSDAGLTYSIGSGFSLRRESGPFAVSTFTRVPEVRRVIDLILAEMEYKKKMAYYANNQYDNSFASFENHKQVNYLKDFVPFCTPITR